MVEGVLRRSWTSFNHLAQSGRLNICDVQTYAAVESMFRAALDGIENLLKGVGIDVVDVRANNQLPAMTTASGKVGSCGPSREVRDAIQAYRGEWERVFSEGCAVDKDATLVTEIMRRVRDERPEVLEGEIENLTGARVDEAVKGAAMLDLYQQARTQEENNTLRNLIPLVPYWAWVLIGGFLGVTVGYVVGQTTCKWFGRGAKAA